MSEAHETDAPELDTEADAAVTDAPPSSEDRAAAIGWTPKEQFKGDPEKWIDADTFLKRGEEILPLLKANNRRLEQALEKQSKETAKVKATLERFAEHHSKTEQRAYERALQEIQDGIDQAAANGDVQGVRDGTERLVDLSKGAGSGAPAPEANPDFDAWQEENPWFGKDKAMTAACAAIGDDVLADGYTGKAQIREVDRRMREAFPEKFAKPTNQNRNLPGAVEGAGAPRRSSGKTYSDLPADAKAACDDFVKRVPGFTRERYIKDYFGQ